MSSNINFSALIDPVARRFWGQPTSVHGNELRWGNKGSRSVNVKYGTWYDHENDIGGGTLDLIMRETACSSSGEAVRWLKDNKFVSDGAQYKEVRKQAEAEDEKESRPVYHKLMRACALADQNGELGAPLAYLKARGIDRVPENLMLLPAEHVGRITHRRYPALVVPIMRREGEMQGAALCWLSADAGTKLNVSNGSPRRFYGELKGGYVPLGWPQPDKPVIIAEGIETTLSVRQVTGLPAIATLSAGNMQSLPTPIGSEIIICADNDNSGTGLKAAEALAERLSGAGRRVRIALPQQRAEDEDRDWNDVLLEAGNDEDKLADMRDSILQAKPFNKTTAVEPVGMDEFLTLQFPPRQFLLKPWLTTTGLTMIDALPGACKTWLALSVGYAVASGNSLMDWTVERRGRVLFVDGELPGELLQSRLRLLGRSEGKFFVLSRSQFEVRGKMMPDLGTQEGRDYLDAVIAALSIDLIILDSVSTLVRSGVDNDVESWRAVQDWSLKHRAQGRAVIYLHHHGRSGNPRGTSSREIVLDSRIKLTRDEEQSSESETAVKLEFAKAREFYGADAAARIAFLSTPSDCVVWRHERVKANTSARVSELAQQGMKPVEIAKELKITKGRVSQIMNELKNPAQGV